MVEIKGPDQDPGYRASLRYVLTDFPHLDESELKSARALGWYDGPIYGTAEYRDRTYWFEFYYFDRDSSPLSYLDPKEEHYFYLLFPLSEELSTLCKEKLDDLARRQRIGDWRGFDWRGPDVTEVQPIGWFSDAGPLNWNARSRLNG